MVLLIFRKEGALRLLFLIYKKINIMKLEENKEYDLVDLIGYHPSKRVQTGLFDSDTGSISKIRKTSGGLEYYWDFWSYGWYTESSLPDEAKELVPIVKEQLKGWGHEV